MTNKCRFSVLSLAGILILAATASALGEEEPALATLPYKQLWMLANPDGLPKECKSEISSGSQQKEAFAPTDLKNAYPVSRQENPSPSLGKREI